jgi:hypothetical protein
MLAVQGSNERRALGRLAATLDYRDRSFARATTRRRRRNSTEPLARRIARALAEIADDLRRGR